MMYLSGTNPSSPPTDPFHQSPETCEYSVIESPFLKLSSRFERAVKSNWATASRKSDSKVTKRETQLIQIPNVKDWSKFTRRKKIISLSKICKLRSQSFKNTESVNNQEVNDWDQDIELQINGLACKIKAFNNIYMKG